MRKRYWMMCLTAVIALLAVFLTPVSIKAADAYVIDETGILTSDQILELNDLAEEISLRQKCGVYVIITTDMHGYSESNYAQGLFMNYDLGYGEKDGASGVLLAISAGDSFFDSTAYGAASKYIGTSDLDKLNDLVYEYLAGGDWYGGVRGFIEETDKKLTQSGYTYFVPEYTDPEINPQIVTSSSEQRRNKWLGSLPFAFLGSAAVSTISVLFMKSKNKNTGVAVTADRYIVNNGVKLRVRQDQFTGKTRTVTHVHRDSGGGGSGGGHSYHSSGFSHSSGGRHF